MSTGSPFLLLPRREITIAGQPAVMACTLYSLYQFQQLAGWRPDPGRATLRALLWSLLVTFQPGLTVRDVGGLAPREYAAAVEAAGALMAAPSGKAEAQEEAKPLDWVGTWAIGRVDLGLAETEFWQLGPGLFDALWKRLEDGHERARYGHAMVCAAIANQNVDPERGIYVSPDYYMGGDRHEAELQRIAAQQRAGLRAKLHEGMAVLGGKRKQ